MKKTWNKILSSVLTLCMMISCLTVSASAATRYDAQAALQYAANHWSDGKGLCAEFVSDCLRSGGLNSYGVECTNLFNQLVREVVEGAQIASVQELVTSGNSIPVDANQGRVAAGDALFWVCDGCPKDDVGGDAQHTALVTEVSNSGIRITQHNTARDNVVATVNNCYCCGRRYSRLVVIHFGDSAAAPEPAAPEYFDCNVQVNCTYGQQVNLYRNAGDTQRVTYFSRGQTAYAAQGANVNGETWYQIQALDNKGQPTWYWLKANANGVTIIDQTPQPPQQEQQQQESSSSSRAYFDCDAEIRTTSGVTVNLYRNPGDTTRATYFSKGQTCWASKGVKLEDGTVWYQVQAMDGGQAKTFWLNAGSAGVTVTEHGPTNSWITADIQSMDLSLNSNPSGLVRLDFSEKRISGGYQGDEDLNLIQPEWVEVGDTWAVAKFTATQTGSGTYVFSIVPEDGSQGAWVTFQINVAP